MARVRGPTTGFPEGDARRVGRATVEWERRPKGPPARRRGWRPMATVSAVVRVTSLVQDGVYFPGVVREFDSETGTWSDADALAWVVGANGEQLSLLSYVCDLVGEHGPRPVWATACCASVGEGSGSGSGTGGPTDGFAETLYVTPTDRGVCPCFGSAPIPVTWNPDTGHREGTLTATCNGLETEIEITLYPGDSYLPWHMLTRCTNSLGSQSQGFDPTSTTESPLSVIFSGITPDMGNCCNYPTGSTMDFEVNE